MLKTLLSIVTCSTASDLCLDIYYELPIFTIDPSCAMMDDKSEPRAVCRSGRRSCMSMVHLTLYVAETLCKSDVSQQEMEYNTWILSKLLSYTILSVSEDYDCGDNRVASSIEELDHTCIHLRFSALQLAEDSSISWCTESAYVPRIVSAMRAQFIEVSRFVVMGSHIVSIFLLEGYCAEIRLKLQECISSVVKMIGYGPSLSELHTRYSPSDQVC